MAVISVAFIASRYRRSGGTRYGIDSDHHPVILLFGGGFGYYRGGYYSRVVVMASAGYSGLS